MEAQHAVGKNLEALKTRRGARGRRARASAGSRSWPRSSCGSAAPPPIVGDDTKSIPGFKDAFAAALAGRDDKTLKESPPCAWRRSTSTRTTCPTWTTGSAWRRRRCRAARPSRTSRASSSTRTASRSIASGASRSGCAASRQHAQKKHDEPLNEWELTMLGIAAGDAGQFAEAIDWLQRGVDFAAKEFGATPSAHARDARLSVQGAARPRRVRQGARRVSGRVAHGARGRARQSVPHHAPAALPRLDAARDEALRRGQEAAAPGAEGRQGRGAARAGADRRPPPATARARWPSTRSRSTTTARSCRRGIPISSPTA